MTTSHFDRLTHLCRQTVDTMIEMFPFGDEAEMETITGYFEEDFKALSRSLNSGRSTDQLSPNDRNIVWYAASSIISMPFGNNAFYRERLGEEIASTMRMLMDKMEDMGCLRTRR